jgi:hypothetical protein
MLNKAEPRARSGESGHFDFGGWADFAAKA